MNITNELVAYAVISAKLEKGQNVFSAFTPFFKTVMNEKKHSVFSPEDISAGVKEYFGIEIPSLAVEGMIPSLVSIGFLKKERIGLSSTAQYTLIDKSNNSSLDRSNLIVNAENAISDIVGFVKRRLEEKFDDIGDENYIYDKILESLVNPVIWYSRVNDNSEINLKLAEAIEFHTLEYVMETKESDKGKFEEIAKITTSSLAVSFLNAFKAPSKKSNQFKADFYLDTMIVAAVIGVSSNSLEAQMKSVLQKCTSMNSRFCVLSDNVSELHNVLVAATNSHKDDKRKERSIDRRLRVDAAARKRAQHFINQPEAHLKSHGLQVVNVERDYKNILKHFTHKNVEEFITRIRVHGDVSARAVDARSVGNIGRFLRNANRACHDLFQMPAVYVSDNDDFVNKANRYLEELHYYQHPQCPPFIMHTHLAAAAWLSSGAITTDIATEHLISNCMLLIEANANLFERVEQFLEEIDPEDAELFSDSISNDRSALMVASQFVGTSKSVNKELSINVLSDVVKEAEERAEAEAAVRYNDEMGKLETKHMDSKKHSKVKFDKVARENKNLSKRLEDLTNEKLEEEALKDDEIAALKDEVRRQKRFGSVPYFIFFSAVLFVISNSIGLSAWTAEIVEIFGYSFKRYQLSILLLVLILVISWQLTRMANRIIK